MEKRRLLLVRHCEVEDRCQQVCYGRSDVALSERGILQSKELVHQLAREPITHVYHSGLTRTRILAEELASRLVLTAQESPSLRERDFGEWELRTWDELFSETADALIKAIHEPATWRPPGGETTFEVRDRVLAWYGALPATGVIAAITHGGVIATLRGVLAEKPVAAWLDLIPDMGTMVEIY